MAGVAHKFFSMFNTLSRGLVLCFHSVTHRNIPAHQRTTWLYLPPSVSTPFTWFSWPTGENEAGSATDWLYIFVRLRRSCIEDYLVGPRGRVLGVCGEYSDPYFALFRTTGFEGFAAGDSLGLKGGESE